MRLILSKLVELIVGCIAPSAVAISTSVLFVVVAISHSVWVVLTFTAIVSIEIFGNGDNLQESVFVSWFIALLAVVLSCIAARILSYAVPSISVQATIITIVPFMALTIRLRRHLDALPAQSTIRGFRILLNIGYYGLATWNIITADSLPSLPYTLVSNVRLAVLMLMLIFDVTGLNGRPVQKTIMITTCLIFCLYCEALGLQPSANLGRLDESVTGIVNRSEKESGQGSPGR